MSKSDEWCLMSKVDVVLFCSCAQYGSDGSVPTCVLIIWWAEWMRSSSSSMSPDESVCILSSDLYESGRHELIQFVRRWGAGRPDPIAAPHDQTDRWMRWCSFYEWTRATDERKWVSWDEDGWAQWMCVIGVSCPFAVWECMRCHESGVAVGPWVESMRSSMRSTWVKLSFCYPPDENTYLARMSMSRWAQMSHRWWVDLPAAWNCSPIMSSWCRLFAQPRWDSQSSMSQMRNCRDEQDEQEYVYPVYPVA